MQSYLVHTKTTHTAQATLPAVAGTTAEPVGAAVLAPQARINLAAQAVDRVQGNLDALLSGDSLLPRSGFAHAVSKYEITAFTTAVLTGASAFITLIGSAFDARLLIPTALAGGVCAALGVQMYKNDKAVEAAKTRVLDTKDLGPTLQDLQQASSAERELVRPHVEQRTASLAAAKRLTPKAALALRKAIGSATPGTVEAQRAASIVAFARDAADSKANPALAPLVEILSAATPEERIATAEYLERTLFPNERPHACFTPNFAHQLYAIIDSASRGEVPELLRASTSES